jgi:hypothetical protein
MRGERYNPIMCYSLKFISSTAVKFIGTVAAFFTLLFDDDAREDGRAAEAMRCGRLNDGAPRSAAVRGGRLFIEARRGEGFLFIIRWT